MTLKERMDREHLKRCNELVVLMLDGWKESRGVQAEIRIALELGKPVRYLDPSVLDSDASSVPSRKPSASRCSKSG